MIELGFIQITFWDILDIGIFGFLIYKIYKLLRGSVGFYIFFGLLLLYGLWWLFSFLRMDLMSSLLGQFASIGVILLIVVFQPEIRRFLLILGANAMKGRLEFLKRIFQLDGGISVFTDKVPIKESLKGAILSLAKRNIGALIVFARAEHLYNFRETGVRLDARISQMLIESIFEKTSPLHDGALIIVGNRLYAASCILPLSYDPGLPLKYGLRHRAAIGATELTDIEAIVISEETGNVSLAKGGKIFELKEEADIDNVLNKYDY